MPTVQSGCLPRAGHHLLPAGRAPPASRPDRLTARPRRLSSSPNTAANHHNAQRTTTTIESCLTDQDGPRYHSPQHRITRRNSRSARNGRIAVAQVTLQLSGRRAGRAFPGTRAPPLRS